MFQIYIVLKKLYIPLKDLNLRNKLLNIRKFISIINREILLFESNTTFQRTSGNLVDPSCSDATTDHEVAQRALRSGMRVRRSCDWLMRFVEERRTRNLCELMDQMREVVGHVEKWTRMVTVATQF